MTMPDRACRISTTCTDRRRGLRALGRFWRDDSGTPAIELAFVAPILVLVLLSAVEITNALQATRRATATVNVIADLVSRETTVPNGGSLSNYAAELALVGDNMLQSVNATFAFHVAHVYHDASGQYDYNNDATWQFNSGPSAEQCEGADLDPPGDFTTNDSVHAVAPEFRQVLDNRLPDPEANPVRTVLTNQPGSVVVVRLRYCYQPLLLGVLPGVVGPAEVVASYAPRNTSCIEGPYPSNDCTDILNPQSPGS